MDQTLPLAETNTPANLRRKIQMLIWALRAMGLLYVVWVFWLIIRPWRHSDVFLQRIGTYWQRDLSASEPWQIGAVVVIDLCLWLLLPIVVACWWKASALLLHDMGLSEAASHWLRRGAWFGMSCTALSVLSRPLTPYLYTVHLPEADRLWLWNVNPSDILGLMLSCVLLMLSYLMVWMAQIAEENKAFV